MTRLHLTTLVFKKKVFSQRHFLSLTRKRGKNDAIHVNDNKMVKCVVLSQKARPIARRIDTRFEYSSLGTVPARQNTTFYGKDGTCT